MQPAQPSASPGPVRKYGPSPPPTRPAKAGHAKLPRPQPEVRCDCPMCYDIRWNFRFLCGEHCSPTGANEPPINRYAARLKPPAIRLASRQRASSSMSEHVAIHPTLLLGRKHVVDETCVEPCLPVRERDTKASSGWFRNRRLLRVCFLRDACFRPPHYRWSPIMCMCVDRCALLCMYVCMHEDIYISLYI